MRKYYYYYFYYVLIILLLIFSLLILTYLNRKKKINDNSKDNTSIIINKFDKEDNRIKILNNEKNMATLYSRNIGILMSREKYIMYLGNDDLFMYFDVFTTVYNETEKAIYDIIGFQTIDWIDCSTYNPSIIQMKDALYHSHKEGLTLYLN